LFGSRRRWDQGEEGVGTVGFKPREQHGSRGKPESTGQREFRMEGDEREATQLAGAGPSGTLCWLRACTEDNRQVL
jgi:hypothetical protein